MAIEKQSFLSNIVGANTYHEYKGYAKTIITGTSILFIVYIAALVLVLDIQVDVDEPESGYWYKPEKKPRPTTYKLTVVWGVVLIALGISAIYFSNQSRKNYAFECDTFLVDLQAGIYHFDWDNDCEVASEATDLEKMQGYQIDKSYTLCEWCKEWAEEVESDY